MDKVKIRDTNSIFDGMSGTVESEDGDKVTVMVDFKAGRKVRNTFDKSCISGLDEDIEAAVLDDRTNWWQEGSAELMAKIKNAYESNPNVSDFKFHQDVYPARDYCLWYDFGSIFSFVYKNRIRLEFFRSGDMCIYLNDDEDNGITSVEELEELGIYTDEALVEVVNDDYGWEEDYSYIQMDAVLLWPDGSQERDCYSWDWNFEDLHSIEEIANAEHTFSDLEDWIPDLEDDNDDWRDAWRDAENGEPIEEDIKEADPEDDADYLSKEEKCKLALSEYLEVDSDNIEFDRKDDGGYVFEISDEIDGEYSSSIWWVFMSYNDAYDAAYDRYKEYIEYDADLVDYFGYDTLMDYIDEDAFDDQMDTYYSDYVQYDMDEEDIIDECERRGILDPDDREIEKVTKYRVLDGAGDVYEDDFEEAAEAEAAADSYNEDEALAEDGPYTIEEYKEELDDEGTYPEDVLESAKDELVEDMKNHWSSSLEWYRETYGVDSLKDDIRNGYVNVDLDSLIDNYFTDDEVPYQLAWYDNEEQYIDIEWLHQDFYLYRRE